MLWNKRSESALTLTSAAEKVAVKRRGQRFSVRTLDQLLCCYKKKKLSCQVLPDSLCMTHFSTERGAAQTSGCGNLPAALSFTGDGGHDSSMSRGTELPNHHAEWLCSLLFNNPLHFISGENSHMLLIYIILEYLKTNKTIKVCIVWNSIKKCHVLMKSSFLTPCTGVCKHFFLAHVFTLWLRYNLWRPRHAWWNARCPTPSRLLNSCVEKAVFVKP